MFDQEIWLQYSHPISRYGLKNLLLEPLPLKHEWRGQYSKSRFDTTLDVAVLKMASYHIVCYLLSHLKSNWSYHVENKFFENFQKRFQLSTFDVLLNPNRNVEVSERCRVSHQRVIYNTCITRHPHFYSCKALFVWHQSSIVKSYTHTNTPDENMITSLLRMIIIPSPQVGNCRPFGIAIPDLQIPTILIC